MANEVGSHTAEPFLHCARSGREKRRRNWLDGMEAYEWRFDERGLDVITT